MDANMLTSVSFALQLALALAKVTLCSLLNMDALVRYGRDSN